MSDAEIFGLVVVIVGGVAVCMVARLAYIMWRTWCYEKEQEEKSGRR